MQTTERYDSLREAMVAIRRENPEAELAKHIDFQLAQLRRAFGVLYRQELPVYRQKEFACGYISPIIEFLEWLDEL